MSVDKLRQYIIEELKTIFEAKLSVLPHTPGEPLSFDDLPGWQAKPELYGDETVYRLYKDPTTHVATLYADGNLRYVLNGEVGYSPMKKASGFKSPYTAMKYLQAMMMKPVSPVKKNTAVVSENASEYDEEIKISDLKIKGLPWKIEDISDIYKKQYKYAIFNEHGKRVGIIGQYGLLYVDDGTGSLVARHRFYIDMTGPKSIRNAIRYVYVMTSQGKVPSKTSEDNIDEAHNDKSNKFKELTFDDLPGWKAVRILDMPNNYNKYKIYNKKNEQIGNLYDDGKLYYSGALREPVRKIEKFGTDIHKAMLYVALMTMQPKVKTKKLKNIKESSKTQPEEPISFSDLPGWTAHVIKKPFEPGYYIYNEKNFQVASLYADGELRYSEYNNAPVRTVKNFGYNIHRAMKYVFAMLMKPVTESILKEYNEIITDIAGIKGWKATRFNSDDGYDFWRIDDEKNTLVGAISDNGFLIRPKTSEYSVRTPSKMPNLINKPAQTARYLYIMKQKPAINK